MSPAMERDGSSRSEACSEELLAELAWVKRIARQLLGDDDLADDLAQETLAAAIERPPSFANDTRRLRAWLAGVARHLASRHLRERRQRLSLEVAAAHPEADCAEADSVARLRLHRRLTKAVMDLDEPYRSTIVQRYLDDLPAHEIARRAGLPAATVRKRLSRALEMLRGRLDREFGDRSSWRTALLVFQSGGPFPLAGPVGMFGVVVLKKIVMKKILISAIAVAVLLASGVWWLGQQDSLPADTGQRLVARKENKASPDARARDTVSAREELRVRVREELFTVEVLGANAVAISNARVVAWYDDLRVEKKATDADGRVSFKASSSGGGILVLSSGSAPTVRKLDHLSGTFSVTVKKSRAVAGRVLVDASVPRIPVRLTLHTYGLSAFEGIPEAVRDELPQYAKEEVSVETASDGSFRFGGLPADWRGYLRVPRTHWLLIREAAEQRVLSLAAPDTELRLHLTRLPTVKGRLLWEHSTKAVTDGGVNLMVNFVDGRQSPLIGGRAREDGYFEVEVFPSNPNDLYAWRDPDKRVAIAQIKIWPVATGQAKQKTFEFDAAKLPELGDVGDLFVRRADRLHFLVQDPQGAPVPLAVVADPQPSKPADAEGRGTFGLGDLGTHRYLVGAPGYQVVRLRPTSGDGTTEHPLVFVISPGNMLEAQVRDANGAVPQGVRWKVAAKSPLFSESDRLPTRVHRAIGLETGRGTWGSKGGNYQFPVSATGKTVIPGLRPMVQMKLSILDELSYPLVERKLASPKGGESKRVELLVTQKSTQIKGRVLDETGLALGSVRVLLRGRHGGRSETTDGKGQFSFEHVYATGDRVHFFIKHSGYAEFKSKESAIREQTGPFEFRLSRGYDVRISVVDEDGRPVHVAWVGIVDKDHRHRGTRVDTANFLFKDLPMGEQRFVCTIAGKDFELRHSAARGNARLVVPRVGRVEVTAPSIPRNAKFVSANVLSVSGSWLASWSLRWAGQGWASREKPLLPGTYVIELKVLELVKGKFEQQTPRPSKKIVVKQNELARCRFSNTR